MRNISFREKGYVRENSFAFSPSKILFEIKSSYNISFREKGYVRENSFAFSPSKILFEMKSSYKLDRRKDNKMTRNESWRCNLPCFCLAPFFYYFYSNNWNTQSSIPPSKHHNSWSSTMLFKRSIHLMNLINVRNLLIPRLKALKIRLMLEFPWQLLGDRNLLIPSLTVLKNRLILWLRLEFSWLLSDDLSILSFSLDCFTLCVLQPSLDNACFD